MAKIFKYNDRISAKVEEHRDENYMHQYRPNGIFPDKCINIIKIKYDECHVSDF